MGLLQELRVTVKIRLVIKTFRDGEYSDDESSQERLNQGPSSKNKELEAIQTKNDAQDILEYDFFCRHEECASNIFLGQTVFEEHEEVDFSVCLYLNFRA